MSEPTNAAVFFKSRKKSSQKSEGHFEQKATSLGIDEAGEVVHDEYDTSAVPSRSLPSGKGGSSSQSGSVIKGNKSTLKVAQKVSCFDEDENPDEEYVGDKKSKASKVFTKAILSKADVSVSMAASTAPEDDGEVVQAYSGGSYSKESLAALRMMQGSSVAGAGRGSSTTAGQKGLRSSKDKGNGVYDAEIFDSQVSGEQNTTRGMNNLRKEDAITVQTFELSGTDAEDLEAILAAQEEKMLLDREELDVMKKPAMHPLFNSAIESYIGQQEKYVDDSASASTVVMDDFKVKAILASKKHKSNQDLSLDDSSGRVYTSNLVSSLDTKGSKKSRQYDIYNSVTRSSSNESEDWETIVMKRAMASRSKLNGSADVSVTSGRPIQGSTNAKSTSNVLSGKNTESKRGLSISDLKSLLVDARDKISSNISGNDYRVEQLNGHLKKYESDKSDLTTKMNVSLQVFNTFKEIRQVFVDIVSMMRAKSPMVSSLLSTQASLWRDSFFRTINRKRLKDQSHLLSTITKANLLHDVDEHCVQSNDLKSLIKDLRDLALRADPETSGHASGAVLLDCFKNQLMAFRRLIEGRDGIQLPMMGYPGGLVGENFDLSSEITSEVMILPQLSPQFLALYNKFGAHIVKNNSEFLLTLTSLDSSSKVANLESTEYLENNLDDIVALIDYLENELLYDFDGGSAGRSVCSGIVQTIDSKLSTLEQASSIIFDDVEDEIELGCISLTNSTPNNIEGSKANTTNKIRISDSRGLLSICNYIRLNFEDKYASTFISEALPDILMTYLTLPACRERLWLSHLSFNHEGGPILRMEKQNFRCNFEKYVDFELIRGYSTGKSRENGRASSNGNGEMDIAPSEFERRESTSSTDIYDREIDETLLPRAVSKAWTPILSTIIELSFNACSVVNSIQCRNYILQSVLYSRKGTTSDIRQIVSALMKRVASTLDSVVVPIVLSSAGVDRPLLCLPSLRPIIRIQLRRLCRALLCCTLVCEGIVPKSTLFKIVYRSIVVARRGLWKLFYRESLDFATKNLFLVLLSILCSCIPESGSASELPDLLSSQVTSSADSTQYSQDGNYNLFTCINDVHEGKTITDKDAIVTNLLHIQLQVDLKIMNGSKSSRSAPFCSDNALESIQLYIKNILRVI